MDLFDGNHCKFLFASLSISMVFASLLMNLVEPHLPIFITRTFRYGKFASQQESSLVKSLEVPKSYFRHFYLSAALLYCPLMFNEVVSVYVFGNKVSDWMSYILDVTCGSNRIASESSTHVFIAVSLIILQCFRRFYDTHFVSVFSTKATMNLTHYLIGMVYYPALMLIVLSEAQVFSPSLHDNFTNGLDWRQIGLVEITAIVLFLWAWYHQHIATVILANLRKNKKGVVVSDKYEMPRGDWFDYLSSPHSFAEILMYTALTMLLARNTGWWFVYAWILSNQIETMLLSHWWYQGQFKEFPKRRKALIPFVY